MTHPCCSTWESSALSSIAGVPLPSDSSNKSVEALERIISYDFFVNEFLPYIKLENLVAIKSWEMNSNSINYDSKIYNQDKKIWVRDVSPPFLPKPSNQEAFETYSEIINISESKGNPFITISIESYSPYLAKNWLDLIISRIDTHMRELDKISATKSIAFQIPLSRVRILQKLETSFQTYLHNKLKHS